MADISTFTNQQGTFNFKDSVSRSFTDWNYKNGVANILKCTMTSGTSRGVTFTNNNGIITISGTPTSYIDTKYIVGTATSLNPSYEQCVPLPKGSYYLTGLPDSEYISSTRARFILYTYQSSGSSRDVTNLYNTGMTFSIASDTGRYALLLYISNSDVVTYNNLIFKPMLQPALYYTQQFNEWQSYAMSNAELTQAIGDINSVLEEVL